MLPIGLEIERIRSSSKDEAVNDRHHRPTDMEDPCVQYPLGQRFMFLRPASSMPGPLSQSEGGESGRVPCCFGLPPSHAAALGYNPLE